MPRARDAGAARARRFASAVGGDSHHGFETVRAPRRILEAGIDVTWCEWGRDGRLWLAGQDERWAAVRIDVIGVRVGRRRTPEIAHLQGVG